MYGLKIEKQINYSYHDIERYLNSQMTRSEMHAFEKAMMDDPMLSDAVDGYRLANYSATDDLAVITQQLKAVPAKVVRGSFKQWIRIAAVLVVLLSASVVLYRIYYSDNKNAAPALVKTKEVKEEQIAAEDETKVDSATVVLNDNVTLNTTQPKPVIIPPAKTIPSATLQAEDLKEQNFAVVDKPAAQQQAAPSSANLSKEPETKEETAKKQSSEQVKLNKFVGRIVDESNHPLPFANITEKNSGVGTYADANGNFVLLSADTVLNVQTKSLGHISNTAVLRSAGVQKIILKDEAIVANAPTQEVFYDRYKKRKEKENTDTTDEIMAIPVDGWSNYNIYVYNNMRDDAQGLQSSTNKTQKPREVQLVFDVNPDGSLTNIKVERSTCRACNEEAIRLLKEGPKWKSISGKKESTRFTVRF